MKTTLVSTQHVQTGVQQYVVYKSTVLNKYRLLYTTSVPVHKVCSYMESNTVLV